MISEKKSFLVSMNIINLRYLSDLGEKVEDKDRGGKIYFNLKENM